MNTTPVLLVCAALAVTTASASPARAKGAADPAAAEVLFHEAKRLAAAGDFEQACPKFVESQRLDPTAGTLLNIGDCYEKLGRLASGWGAFKEAEAMARNAGDTVRLAEATRRAEALSTQLSRLAIVISSAARVPGFEVRRDGAMIGEGQWGVPLPVDAGQHIVEARAPGRKAWTMRVKIEGGGAVTTVRVPVLEPVPHDNVASPASERWGAQRIAGAAVGAAGALGLVVGAVLGGLAIAENNASKADCRPDAPAICDPAGYDRRLEAGRVADTSTATFIAGGLALAGGAALFFTAPPVMPSKGSGPLRLEARPLVAGQLTGLALMGWW